MKLIDILSILYSDHFRSKRPVYLISTGQYWSTSPLGLLLLGRQIDKSNCRDQYALHRNSEIFGVLNSVKSAVLSRLPRKTDLKGAF